MKLFHKKLFLVIAINKLTISFSFSISSCTLYCYCIARLVTIPQAKNLCVEHVHLQGYAAHQRQVYHSISIHITSKDEHEAGILCGSYVLYVTGFKKNHLPHTIINIDFNYLKCCILEKKTDACMQFTMILQLYIHSLSMDQLLNGWLAELHTILDSFLTDVANTTSTPLGVVDGGWIGTTKCWAKITSTLKTVNINGIHWYHFQLHIPHKAA